MLRRKCWRTNQLSTMSEQAKAFREIARNRRSASRFKRDPIDAALVQDILETTRRAPSGFNIQPYAGILLTKEKDRELLSNAMLGSNVQKVQEAPLVMVFAADLEPSKRVPELQKLEHEAGVRSVESIANLPMHLSMFANEGALGAAIKLAMSSTMTSFRPVPSYAPTIAWAYKQTIFAASTFLLAAESHGLATCPMEGFDERRVKHCLDVPDRYSVPVIIASGYHHHRPPEEDQDQEDQEQQEQHDHDPIVQQKTTPRFPLSDLFFSGRFGAHLYQT